MYDNSHSFHVEILQGKAKVNKNKFNVFEIKSQGHLFFLKISRDFPGGSVVKNPPADAGDTGLSPGPGRSHMLRSK